MRQGTGKVKHLSGKILLIQDAMREGVIQLIQVPTIWNLSDIGTKAPGVQRVKLLLHELNVASGENFAVVAKTQFQSQQERHGGNDRFRNLQNK